MNMKKWGRQLLLGALLLLIGVSGIFHMSVTETQAAAKKKIPENAWAKINGVCYNGSGVAIPGAITRGIDVSEWQGQIDWYKVKNSSVDFAFVRISYGTGYKDKYFDYNMQQAEAAGVPVGTYVYSLATTNEQALAEAQLAIESMKGHKVSYPVVFDLEYSRMGNLSPSAVAELAVTFCDEVRKAGYYPMVYCNTNWYRNHIDWSKLTGLPVWLASYGDKIQAPDKNYYNYTIWQSTDGDGGGTLNPTKGMIDGIPESSNCDINFGYVDYTKIVTPRWNPLASYVPSQIAPEPGTEEVKGELVKKGGKTYYYVNGKKAKGWQKINGYYYYFNKPSGEMLKKKLFTPKGKDYLCFVSKSGKLQSNRWVNYKGKRYYVNNQGRAVKGLQYIDGKYYYFHADSAYMYTDQKVRFSNGDIMYFDKDGEAFNKGVKTIREKGKKYVYFFNSDYKAHKGWLKYKGKWFYFRKGKGKKAGTRLQSTTVTSSNGVVSKFNKKGVLVDQYRK